MKVTEKIGMKYEKLIGGIASGGSIIMSLSLLEILIANKQGNVDILIQPLATVFTGVFWSLYGYSKKDYFIIIPNVLGVILGTMTVAAAVYY